MMILFTNCGLCVDKASNPFIYTLIITENIIISCDLNATYTPFHEMMIYARVYNCM